MTPNDMLSELIHVAAEMVRGLHDDFVFSNTTPWYVRARVEKVIDAADEKSKVLAMRLKKVADALSANMRAEKETAPTLSERMRDAGFKSRRAAIPDEPEGETGVGGFAAIEAHDKGWC